MTELSSLIICFPTQRINKKKYGLNETTDKAKKELKNACIG